MMINYQLQLLYKLLNKQFTNFSLPHFNKTLKYSLLTFEQTPIKNPIHFNNKLKWALKNPFDLMFIFILNLIVLQIQNSSMFDGRNPPIAYLLTEDFNADHIEQLVQVLDKNSIPYILQKETDTLGQPLDRRYFVIVDNIKGTVVLGPEFSSVLMFVVGYPKKGSNKKNYYCKKTQDVVARYRQFCALPDPEKTNYDTSIIKSKSQFKTIKSIPRSRQSSSLIHQRSQSCTQKSIKSSMKIRSITNIDSGSRIFLLKQKTGSSPSPSSSPSALSYNKQILKISQSNPQKFRIVQNIDQLKNILKNCPSKYNQLIMDESWLEDVSNRDFQNLNIIVYESQNGGRDKKEKDSGQKIQKKGEKGRNVRNNIKFCRSFDQIVNQLKKKRNQIVSFKDISQNSQQIQQQQQNIQHSDMKYNTVSNINRNMQKLKTKKIVSAKAISNQNQENALELQFPVRSQLVSYAKTQNSIEQANQYKFQLQSNKQIIETEYQMGVKLNQNTSKVLNLNDNYKNKGQFVEVKPVPTRISIFPVKNVPNLSQNKVEKQREKQIQRQAVTQQSVKRLVMEQNNKINQLIINKAQNDIKSNKIIVNNIGNFPESQTKQPSNPIIRKIKRIKSAYVNKAPKQKDQKIQPIPSLSPASNPQPSSLPQAVSQSGLKNPTKYIRRKILLPQQYCQPISPATTQTQTWASNRVKSAMERKVRSRSLQPEIHYIGQEQEINRNMKYSIVSQIPQMPYKTNKIYKITKIHPISHNQYSSQSSPSPSPQPSPQPQPHSNFFFKKPTQTLTSTNGTDTENNFLKQSKSSYNNNSSSVHKNGSQHSIKQCQYQQKQKYLCNPEVAANIYDSSYRQQVNNSTISLYDFCTFANIHGHGVGSSSSNASKISKIRSTSTEQAQYKTSIIQQQPQHPESAISSNPSPYYSHSHSHSHSSYPSQASCPKLQLQLAQPSIYPYTPLMIVYKQFNYDIEQTVQYMQKQIKNTINYVSFYGDKQLSMKICAKGNANTNTNGNGNGNIVVLIDDIDIQTYLTVLYKSGLPISAIYLFPKSNYSVFSVKNIVNRKGQHYNYRKDYGNSQPIEGLLYNSQLMNNFGHLIKIVNSNQYSDNKWILKQIRNYLPAQRKNPQNVNYRTF